MSWLEAAKSWISRISLQQERSRFVANTVALNRGSVVLISSWCCHQQDRPQRQDKNPTGNDFKIRFTNTIIGYYVHVSLHS
jgi:hypothetical protein